MSVRVITIIILLVIWFTSTLPFGLEFYLVSGDFGAFRTTRTNKFIRPNGAQDQAHQVSSQDSKITAEELLLKIEDRKTKNKDGLIICSFGPLPTETVRRTRTTSQVKKGRRFRPKNCENERRQERFIADERLSRTTIAFLDI